MTKKEVQQRVLKNGKPLGLDKFEWDKETNTFSTTQSGLVLDFSDISDCTFNTGYYCTFDTESGCTFKTGSCCTFKTGSNCTFKTGSGCTFDTGSGCTFKTGSGCTFKTWGNCTFKTWGNCTFKTESGCTFNTGYYCTFDTGYYCTFDTCSDCVVVRRDVYEIIELEKGKPIKLNGYGVLGYEYLEKTHTIIIDGKDIELSEESFNNLKEQLND